jgi:hypothetical protein
MSIALTLGYTVVARVLSLSGCTRCRPFGIEHSTPGGAPGGLRHHAVWAVEMRDDTNTGGRRARVVGTWT